MSSYERWFQTQNQELKKEIGTDLKQYWKKPLTLEQLKELDKRFINSPEGNNERSD